MKYFLCLKTHFVGFHCLINLLFNFPFSCIFIIGYAFFSDCAVLTYGNIYIAAIGLSKVL